MTNPIAQEIQRLERALQERSSRLARPWVVGGGKQFLFHAVAWAGWLMGSAWLVRPMYHEQNVIAAIAFFINLIFVGGFLAYVPDLLFVSKKQRVQNILQSQRQALNILHSLGREDLVSAIKVAYEEGNNNTSWWYGLSDVLRDIAGAHATQDVFLNQPTDIVEVEAQWVEADSVEQETHERARAN